MGDAFSRPDCQLETCLQIEERHRTMLKLRAGNSFGFQTQAIPIEPQRPLQVIDSDGNESDPGSQGVVIRKA